MKIVSFFSEHSLCNQEKAKFDDKILHLPSEDSLLPNAYLYASCFKSMYASCSIWSWTFWSTRLGASEYFQIFSPSIDLPQVLHWNLYLINIDKILHFLTTFPSTLRILWTPLFLSLSLNLQVSFEMIGFWVEKNAVEYASWFWTVDCLKYIVFQ